MKVRRDAVRSLGQIGRAAKPALPEIKALIVNKDEDKEVVKYAEAAVTAITGGEKLVPHDEKGE
jgi:hypothetical protein